MGGQLLERDAQLDALTRWWAEATAGSGLFVLVAGEAGVGKTTLVRRFAATLPADAQTLVGACEPLATPLPLGPLFDMASTVDSPLEGALMDGDPLAVRRALLDTMARSRGGTLVVVEDAHWADEATLDVLRHTGRRLGGRGAMLLVTYRDEEVGPRHPLRVLIGDLATLPELRRLEVTPLSPGAVSRLAEGMPVDPHDLHRRTGGNPFFVTEVLAAGSNVLPDNVRDAVLARASRLAPEAREALDGAACLGARVSAGLVETVSGQGPQALDQCLESGVMVLAGDEVTFRHELARLAVQEAVPPRRASAYHARALAALSQLPAADVDPARLADHAQRAGDRAALLHYARAAGERASRLAAHREAAAHYATALAVGEDLSAEERASLLEAQSREYFMSQDLDGCIEAGLSALDVCERAGDRRGQARALIGQLNAYFAIARWVPRVEPALGRATTLLEGLPPCPELAMVYAGRAALALLAFHNDDALEWAERARRVAEGLGGAAMAAGTLLFSGLGRVQKGDVRGWQLVDESGLPPVPPRDAFAAKAAFWPYHVAVTARQYEAAERWFTRGMSYATEYDLEPTRQFLLAHRARQLMEQGRWDEAETLATGVVARERRDDGSRSIANEVLGRILVRRGDPDALSVVEETHAIVDPAEGIVDWIVRRYAALAEHHWLSGDRAAIPGLLAKPMAQATALGEPWWLGELAFWLWRTGGLDEPPPGAAEPYALLITGQWKEARDAWLRVGCPYEAAQALACSDDEGALREALDVFDGLGARGERDEAARRLRRLGVRDIPKASRAAAGSVAEGLSPREAEVLALVGEGLRNAEIATKLFLSERTVEHHVAAVLRKLGVRSRVEAGRWARERHGAGAISRR